MVSAKEMVEGNIKPDLEDGEVLRFSILRDGIVISKDEKEHAVSNTFTAIGFSLGSYAAHNEEDVENGLTDFLRAYKMGYDTGKKSRNVETLNVLVDGETGEVKRQYKRKGTIKQKIDLEEYK